MQRFYTARIENGFAYFEEEEARHIVQVLRRKVGEVLHFVDGKGGLYEGQIEETGKKLCVLSIQKAAQPYTEVARRHIAIAPTKNIGRFEWFLEKATEIGVDEITPLLCQRSERQRLRPERLNKILIAAMKQSLRTYLPKLHPLTPFAELLKQSQHYEQCFIAHCGDGPIGPLRQKYQPGKSVLVLIGPEGDFSPEEVQLALDQGLEPVGLGDFRLRTETAGITACHTINLLLNQ